LQGIDQCLTGLVTLDAPKILGGNDYDLIASVHGDMLWALATHPAHQFAKSRFGILK
jgi:hypothetical protein